MFTRKKIYRHYKQNYIIFSLILLLLLFFLFDIKKVKGSSMFSSIKENDLTLIFRAMYGIKSPFSNKYLIRWKNVKKGDVVMYKIRGKYVIKRCYATDDDVIHFYQKESEYFMYIEEKIFKLKKASYHRLFFNYSPSMQSGMQKVPEGSLLLLGDNVSSSFDSKDYGYVTQNSILGKVILWN
ncbi:MAG: signal peptidase I [Treponema sp.]